MINLDAIAHTSKVKDFYPKTRISLILGALIFSIFVNSKDLYLAFLGISILWMLMTTSLNLKSLLKLLSIPMFFVITSTIVIMVSLGKSLPADVVFKVNIGSIFLFISKANLVLALETFLRSLCGISMIFCISTTVPMGHFMKWLKLMHFPEEFIELFVLTYRFIFILIEEALDLVIAGDMSFGNISIKNAFQTMCMMIRSCLHKTFKRYEDLSQALELRQNFDDI